MSMQLHGYNMLGGLAKTGNRVAIHAQRRWLVMLAMLLCLPHAVMAEDTASRSTLLAQAQEAYDQAVAMQAPNRLKARTLFSDALKKYESVLDQDVQNAGVLFNAGNAAYRLGDYAKAIVYYRRALLIEPNAADIQQNLSQARRQVTLQIEPPTERKIFASLLTYDRWLAPSVWKYLAYAAYVGFWLLLTLRIARWRQPVSVPTALLALCLLLALVAGRAFWVAAERFENPAAGVVARGQTELLKGNGTGYQRRIDEPLTAGVEFELIEQRPDPDQRLWYRIRLADGTDGWILAERALLI